MFAWGHHTQDEKKIFFYTYSKDFSLERQFSHTKDGIRIRINTKLGVGINSVLFILAVVSDSL